MESSSDDPAVVLARFLAGLNDIWIKAGPPSYAEVEALSRKFATPVQGRTLRVEELKRSTLQRILSRKGKTLPKWPWVASLVTVLRVIASQNGVAPDGLGTLDEWKARYEEAWRRFHGRPREEPSSTGELPATGELSATGERPATGEIRDGAAVRGEPREAAASGAPWRVPLPGVRDVRPEPRRPGSRSPGGPQGHGQVMEEHAGLHALARRFKTAGWWHRYRDVVPGWAELYLDLERAARLIQAYEIQFVPGLLQTPEYAEAVIRLEHGTAPEAQIKRRVELRMLRQKRLLGPNPPRLWAILDEAMLSREYGGPATMRAQLEYLLKVSCLPNVGIQVMPLSKGGYAAAGGPITALRFAEERLPDVIYLERLGGADYPTGPADMLHFGQVLDRLSIEAATPGETRDMLRRLCSEK
ncbi:hypothetical protein ETD83_11705 [Actinomadura soli]|uniref:DUF5753 domain-containing protein n=1 Tax=Actinomadura soli TaxID=2508997 RepID=A0A5C4JEW3_9ACTN|nr:DUF5753 domain-containing protein [Actinomadura soli]TMR02993.1 hypothetical protein ETD83_11705 [Actinomadura soli]